VQIAVTGASGFLGRAILRVAHERGHEVVAFSRTPERDVRGAIETRRFDFEKAPDFHGCEAVVHLAGEPILGLWTSRKKRDIMTSRVRGTRRVVEGIERMPDKPEVFVSASAVGIYEDGGDGELSESAPKATDFIGATCEAWENEAAQAKGTRVVSLRLPPVLGRDGGMLKLLKRVFAFGLGGPLGNGQQWMPWIHLEDLARLVIFSIEDMNVRGAVNAVASWPVRNEEFTRTLARVMKRPAVLRVPAWALKLTLRGLSAEMLASRRVVPTAATEFGFGFKFPELEPALRDLLG